MKGVRKWVQGRPITWVVGTAIVFAAIGVGVASVTESKEAPVTDLETQVKDLRDEVATLAAPDEAEASASENGTPKDFIAEDGTWQVGVDFEPGTYRSTAKDCYWEKLKDPSGESRATITNGMGANQTVKIDSPWFSSSFCGKWEKID